MFTGITSPTLKCAQENNSFTVNSTNGNEALILCLILPISMEALEDIYNCISGILKTYKSLKRKDN